MRFLWCAFKDLLLNETLLMKTILPILVIGVVLMFAFGQTGKAIVCLGALLFYLGKFLFLHNRAYSLMNENCLFPILTSEGPQNILSAYDGQKYIRVESPSWEEVQRISFYDNYLVIEMTKKSAYGMMFIWTDDMEKTQQTALSMWRNALDLNGETPQLPKLYSEQGLLARA